MAQSTNPQIASAAIFQVDIYPPNIICDGNSQAPASAGVQFSRKFQQGEPIKLDDAPIGPHLAVLSAYAMATDKTPFASTCILINPGHGDNECLPISFVLLTCDPNKADCNMTKADGCECDVISPVQAQCCSGGCQTKHFTGVDPGVGASQNWGDCVALGVHTPAEGVAACTAFKGTDKSIRCVQLACAPPKMVNDVVCAEPSSGTGIDPCNGADPTKAYPCWSLDNNAMVKGAVRAVAGMCGICPVDGDPPWQ